jgi:hypothetical protein
MSLRDMPSQTTERAFETYVEEILLTRSGWQRGSNAEWDKDRDSLVHSRRPRQICVSFKA